MAPRAKYKKNKSTGLTVPSKPHLHPGTTSGPSSSNPTPIAMARDGTDTDLLWRFAKRLSVLRQSLDALKELKNIRPLLLPTTYTGWVTLPYEIRLQIYYYCIPTRCLIDAYYPHLPSETTTTTILDDDLPSETTTSTISDDEYPHRRSSRTNILLISRQTREECLDILYGKNVFKIELNENGEYLFKQNFTEANIRRIKYLLVIARPRGISYSPQNLPDYVLWASMILNLKQMRIIAKQPTGYYNQPLPRKEMDHWLKWIKDYLACFGYFLGTATRVTVDNDGKKETSELAKICLPHNMREIQCTRFGDYIFKRGRFSVESGYYYDSDDGYYDDGPSNSRDV